MDNDEPIFERPYTDTADPALARDRRLRPDPRDIQSNTERLLPMFTNPKTESDEPNLARDRTERLEPNEE
jgi:hypothetical protein